MQKTRIKKYSLSIPTSPTWCPGCGNFGIWTAFRDACEQFGYDNYNTAMVAGIGCHGHILNYTPISAFEGLHGRALPVASGIKLANPKLNVFVFVGDGDCFGEGGNHFIHSARRNHNITVILHDNAIYGLTTGQVSPLTRKGLKTKSTPEGNPITPFNPLLLALSSGASFIAREYSGNIDNLKKIIEQANRHKGFALIDVIQPCVTFNKNQSHTLAQRQTYYLDKRYDTSNYLQAIEKVQEKEQLPLGVLYQEERKTFEEEFFKLDKEWLGYRKKSRSIEHLMRELT